MRIKLALSSLIALLIATTATAEVVNGNWSSANGEVTVEEDLTTAKYPRHIVALAPLDGSSKAGYLILRCEQNKTEVYFVAADFEFFGFGENPAISARFKSETEAQPLRATNSSDARAAFLGTPIEFVLRLVEEDQVVLAGNYYGSRFTGLYKTDSTILNGIYGMSETCGWSDRLPPRDAPIAADGTDDPARAAPTRDEGKPATVVSNAPQTNGASDLPTALKALVEQYGMPAVLKALGEI